MFQKLKDTVGTAGMLFFVTLMPVGCLYWIWMAIQLKSFVMFVLGIAGPAVLITAPIGAYSLIFGMPDWVQSLFC
jgi:hypothetical protein